MHASVLFIKKKEKKMSVKKYKQRPLSPHISVYNMEYSSMLSIFHRITGVILVVVLIVAGLLYKLQLYNVEVLATLINLLPNTFMGIADMLVWAAVYLVLWMLAYHVSNGIRHLFWDSVISTVSKDYVKLTSRFVIGLTVVIFISLSYVLTF